MRLYTARELTGLEPPRYLVEGLIEERSLSLLSAPSAAGKSFIALLLAFCVAMGRPFGRIHAVKQRRPVVYIAGEGGRSMMKRIAALAHYYGVSLDDIPIYFIIHPVKIRDEEERAALIKVFDSPDPEMGHPLQPGLLIIDTLAQCFGQGDENTLDMQEFTDCMADLRDQRDMAVLAIHHMNAQGTKERGHTSLKAAMDHSFLAAGVRGADRKLKKIVLVNNKNKDDEEAEKVTFAVEPVLKSLVLDTIDGRLSVASAQLREQPTLQRVLANIVETEGKYVNAMTLITRTGMQSNTKQFYAAIDELKDELKLIKKAGTGKYYLSTAGIWVKDQNRKLLTPLCTVEAEDS